MAAAAPTINLVGSDGVAVPIAATHLPIMRSLHTFADETPATTEFVISEADSATLALLREFLDLQAATGIPFKQPPVERTYRGIKTADPCYANGEDPWRATAAAGTYEAAFAAVPVSDLCRLFVACDYLDCDDLLHGIAYVLIPHIFDYTAGVSVEPYYRGLLAKIHVVALTA